MCMECVKEGVEGEKEGGDKGGFPDRPKTSIWRKSTCAHQ